MHFCAILNHFFFFLSGFSKINPTPRKHRKRSERITGDKLHNPIQTKPANRLGNPLGPNQSIPRRIPREQHRPRSINHFLQILPGSLSIRRFSHPSPGSQRKLRFGPVKPRRMGNPHLNGQTLDRFRACSGHRLRLPRHQQIQSKQENFPRRMGPNSSSFRPEPSE